MIPIAGLLLSLVLAAPAPASAASTHTVTLRDIAFTPSSLRIHRGEQVRFVWHDGRTAHNVTSTGKHRFKSASTRVTGTDTVRFTKPGTYTYRCTIHYGMTGRIVVK